jgi:aminoglycoside 2'-N-acetyltransferase I
VTKQRRLALVHGGEMSNPRLLVAGFRSSMPFSIEVINSQALPASTLRDICDLCTEAYEEDFCAYLEFLDSGVHVVGRLDGAIVSHAMWVTRALEVDGRSPLRTAYVEAVATTPAYQRRGFASAILTRLAAEIGDFDLGALSPSEPSFYARLGWESWRGPRFIRTDDGLQPTPGESVMILRLPRTPIDLDLNASVSAEWRPGELW